MTNFMINAEISHRHTDCEKRTDKAHSYPANLEEYLHICNLSKDGETVTEHLDHRSLIGSEKAEKKHI